MLRLVSAKQSGDGDRLQIIKVKQLPPNESFRRRVNLLARYGTKTPLPTAPSFSFVNVRITRCNASKLLLMCKPSCRRCCETPSVASAFSLPAKSTICNFDTTVLLLAEVTLPREFDFTSTVLSDSLPSMSVSFRVTTLCDLELVAFAFVRSVDLRLVP